MHPRIKSADAYCGHFQKESNSRVPSDLGESVFTIDMSKNDAACTSHLCVYPAIIYAREHVWEHAAPCFVDNLWVECERFRTAFRARKSLTKIPLTGLTVNL